MVETIATIATHNGTFTITSVKSGDRRTFRVKTQAADSNFMPGKRIVSLLNGPDNYSNYQGFGFVNDDGTISVWHKKQTQFFVQSANLLANMASHIENGKIEVLAATKCRRCNRKLTVPSSILSGIGPICEGKE